VLYLIVLAVQSLAADTVPTVTTKRDINRRLFTPNSQFT